MAKKKKNRLDQSEQEDLEVEEEELEDDDSSEDLEEEEESSEDEDPEEDDDQTSSKKKKGKKAKKGKSKKSSKSGDDEEEEELDDEDDVEDVEEEEEEELSFLPDDLDMSDPTVKKLAQSINDRMKKAYNKKLTSWDKSVKGKRVIGDFNDLLKDKDFLGWANTQVKGLSSSDVDITSMTPDEALANWSRLSNLQRRKYFTGLKPMERQLFKMQLQIENMSASQLNARERDLEAKVVERFGDRYSSRRNEVSRLRKEIQMNPYITHEEAYKILDYEDYGRRMYKAGKKKGKKNVDTSESLPRKFMSKGKKTKKKKATSVSEAFDMAEAEEED